MYTSNDLFNFYFASLLTHSHSTQEKQGIAGLWISDLRKTREELTVSYSAHSCIYISSSSSLGYYEVEIETTGFAHMF